MLKFYLSPSSQTANRYAFDNNVSEAEVCRGIARLVYEMFDDIIYDGEIAVKLATNGLTVAQRITESNAWGADYHIAIHTNAGGGKGPTIFVYRMREEAMYFNDELSKIAYIPNSSRGIKINQQLAETRNTKAAAIYLELDFHDNLAISAYMHDNQLLYADAIANAISSIAKVAITPSKGLHDEIGLDHETLFTHDILADDDALAMERRDAVYKVQVGAFRDRNNAVKMCKDLAGLGYSAWIKEEK